MEATTLLFEADFEAPGFTVGTLVSDPNSDWSFSNALLDVEVVDVDPAYNLQSLLLTGSGAFTLTADDQLAAQVRWVDFYVKPVFVAEGDLTTSVSSLQSAVSAFVQSGGVGQVYVINGDGLGSGAWVSAEKPLTLTGSVSQDWVRLTYRLDYAGKRWDLFVDDQLALIDLGFLDDGFTSLEAFAIKGDSSTATAFDYFYAGAENPVFVDADNDGINDVFDLNTALNDRDADPDGDSLTNIEEFMHGTEMLARDPDFDLLSDLMELKWGRDPNADDSDLFHLNGDAWETGFEPEEGYLAGALDQQLGWAANSVDVTENENAYAVHSEDTEVFAEHYFGTDPVDMIWFSFDAKLHAGELPDPASLEGQTAAVFTFSDASTLNVLDADSGQWLPYTVEVNPSDWNQYAVFLNYQTKRWDLYLNGAQVAGDIKFRDPELQALSKFKAAMQKTANSTAAAYMDNLKLYSGDDFDADTLGDDWERLYGFNPASGDSDGNATLDIDEDNDSDGLTNAEEFAANANPFSGNTDGDMLTDYLEHAWGRDLTLPETDLGLLAADGLGGLFWQTLFEIDEDNDSDGLTNAEEFAANANPFSGNTDGDMLTDYLEHAWGRDLTLPETDLGLLAADGLGGLFWQTLFEIDEGYTVDTLDGQLDWYASADVAVTADDTASIASPSSTEAYVERYFGTAPEKQIWFSFTGKFFTGAMPDAANLTEPVAAIFGFSAPDTLSVLNPTGNIWETYPITASAEEWNDYAVYFDYTAQTWELYQNGPLHGFRS